MKADDPNLKAQYRMPRVFGALPGPRNVPRDKQHLPDNQTEMVISVTVLTDARLLADLLPPHCMLAGEPLLTVSATFKANIGWLAGRGYAILRVRFPIAHDQGPRGKLTGLFTPVQWENLADPIITGREELGFAKIYAEMPPPVPLGNRYMATASWEGFRFLDIEAFDLEEAPTDPDSPNGSFHYKFIPKNGFARRCRCVLSRIRSTQSAGHWKRWFGDHSAHEWERVLCVSSRALGGRAIPISDYQCFE